MAILVCSYGHRLALSGALFGCGSATFSGKGATGGILTSGCSTCAGIEGGVLYAPKAVAIILV